MTSKRKKAKRQKAQSRAGKVIELQASVEDDLLLLAEEERGAESRWNRPRKQRISLRVDTEVVDWFKSKGPGYQTRINRILRRVMREGKKRAGER
ncbi:MAG TPA: BrnA antitoxin family protein [Candidatus Sulfotelmatobacter sp.]|nr:BrnA antitoxin family protein [Candidatus Sulfotelmatobacter sp.]